MLALCLLDIPHASLVGLTPDSNKYLNEDYRPNLASYSHTLGLGAVARETRSDHDPSSVEILYGTKTLIMR